MKKYLIYLILFQCFNLSINAQSKTSIQKEADFIECDALGNIYLIKGSEIIKYDAGANQKYRYSNNIFGNITSADVSNPLKILLFFDEYSSIIFLNKQLAEIGDVINVYETINIEPGLVCKSKENSFWVYSSLNRIVYLVEKNRVKTQSQNLTPFLNNQEPFQLFEESEYVFLTTKDKVIVLDLFGSYLYSIHLPNVKNISIQNKTISYVHSNKLMQYHLISTKIDSLVIPNNYIPVDIKPIFNKWVIHLDKTIEIISK